MSPPPGWTIAPGWPDATHAPRAPLRLRHPERPWTLARRFDPVLPCTWWRLDLRYDGPGIVDAHLVLVEADGTRLPQRLPKVGRNRFGTLFRPDRPLAAIEVAVSGSARCDAPDLLSLTPVSRWQHRRALAARALSILRGDPRSFPWRAARFLIQVRRGGGGALPTSAVPPSPDAAYALWRERFDERDEERALHRARLAGLTRRPSFAVIAEPGLDGAGVAALRACLEAQVYERWTLMAPADAAALDAAVAEARDDFVFLPKAGTVFRPHALLVAALTLDRHPAAKLVYADDDDLDGGRRSSPRFKPAWSPQRLASHDYVGDPCCVAADALRALGPALPAGAAARRHDRHLRLSERLAPDEVVHVAQVLSHATTPSPPTPAAEADAVVRAHAARLGLPGRAVRDPRSPHPRLLLEGGEMPLVSAIVPTRDRVDLLRLSVGSLRRGTAYPNLEIVVVDNGSREAETRRLFEGWAGDPGLRVLRDDRPFNYAALNNAAAAVARGTVLCLLNNDVEALDAGWLAELVGWALRPGIGCVGAKLHYPDGRLQHGGVSTGIAGAAGHRDKRAPRGYRGGGDDLATVNEVSAVTAACLVVRKDVYVEVGGLDEDAFAVAYNDVDFCLKVARAGYRNLWTPFADLTHHESVSRGRDLGATTAERFARETRALRARWGGHLLDDPYRSPNLTVDAEAGAIRTR